MLELLECKAGGQLTEDNCCWNWRIRSCREIAAGSENLGWRSSLRRIILSSSCPGDTAIVKLVPSKKFISCPVLTFHLP